MRETQHTIVDALGIIFFVFIIFLFNIVFFSSRLPGKFGDPCDFSASYAKHLITYDGLYYFSIILILVFSSIVFFYSFFPSEKILARGLKYYFFRRILLSLLLGVILGYIACEFNTLFAWQSDSFECLGL